MPGRNSTLAIESNQTASLLSRTANSVSTLLIENLSQCRILPKEVQGFTEFQAAMWSCSSPLDLQNILGPRFWRNFDPALRSSIEEIKNSNELDKSQVHAILLKKFLGIEVDSEAIQLSPSLEVNAYQSLPVPNSEDYNLHLYYLQPFMLFGISEQNRKFMGKDLSTYHREWLWHPNPHNSDSAPLFRKIIQLYILSSVISDYDDVDADKNLLNESVKARLEALKVQRETLLSQINDDSLILFTYLENPSVISQTVLQGNPQGWIEDRNFPRQIDNEFHGFMDVMSLYPIGRLLFGQPSVEPHHALAIREINQEDAQSSSWVIYLLSWFIAHLNISTSYFWTQKALNICTKQWTTFKAFITREQDVGFNNLFIQCLMFIPNSLILISTPLLIILPWIYGLSSIPFSLLRTLFINGPFNLLRDFRWLKILDIIETVKDVVLFIIFAVPFLNFIVDAAIVLIPSFLLTPGFATAFVLIAIGFALANKHHFNAEDVYALASLNYFQLIGTAIFTGIGAYLGLGVVLRAILPVIPQSIRNSLAQVASLFANLARPLESVVHYFAPIVKPVNLNEIIPADECQASMELPKVQTQVVISEQLSTEIDSLIRQLGKLNQAFNLSPERKKVIRQSIEDLDQTKAASLAALNTSIVQAKALLANNFTADEAKVMSELINYLKTKDVAIQGTEGNAIMLLNRNMGSYQPSWNILKTLHEQGIIQENGQWQTPNGITISQDLKEKCQRIESFKVA